MDKFSVDQIKKKVEGLKSERSVWESHWQEVAERCFPAQSQTFQMGQNLRSPGEKRTELIFDSTAARGLTKFSAIADSLITPRNSTWHKLYASNPDLNKDRETKIWFEELNRLLFKYRYAPKANFASQNQQVYMSLGAFGTGSMFIDSLSAEPGLRYRALHLGECFFDENHQGVVDTVVRYFSLNARQAVQKFGEANVTTQIREAYKNGRYDRKFFFIHCVKPREDVDYDRVDFKGMPNASYYVAVEGESVLKEEGYSTFPYAISRYTQAPGEVYGRSPAMDALPAIKTLNEQKKTMLKQGHRAVDPVLLVHDDGIIDSFSMKPGALNAGGVSAEGRALVSALPVGNVNVGRDMMMDERADINDAFLVNLFQILTETPQMTATEVMERTREKGILLAPTFGRLQSEYLGPMIEREVDLLMSQGLLPPMPPALIEAKGEYSVEYDSPLSRAQRAEEAAGGMRAIETAISIANTTQNPDVLDTFDFDIIIPEIAEIQGVPARWMKAKEAIEESRAQRAEMAQAQAQMQAAPGVAALTKANAMAAKV